MLLRGLSLLALASALLAQGTNGTIAGQVTDQGGAVIAGVKVTLRQEATSFTREVVSNADGQYAAYAMPPGQYRITIEHPGFRPRVLHE
jgi:protocatechuate 3,4-dioxygenase beta subunit